MTQGILAVWTDVEQAQEADFNAWYDREHVFERVGVPGFRSGRRYRAVSGSPRYLAIYQLDSPAVLDSPAYRQCLERPTDWTRRIMRHFRSSTRAVLTERLRLGTGRGGTVATLRISLRASSGDALPEWLTESALPAAAEMPGIVCARLWLRADEAGSGSSVESRLRTDPDRTVDCAVVIEGTSTAAVRTACSAALGTAELRRQGAAQVRIGVYRLLWGMQAA